MISNHRIFHHRQHYLAQVMEEVANFLSYSDLVAHWLASALVAATFLSSGRTESSALSTLALVELNTDLKNTN